MNPDFVGSFELDYYFEEQSLLKFAIYDIDNHGDNAALMDQDFLGEATVNLHEVMNAPNCQVQLPIDVAKIKSVGRKMKVAEDGHDGGYLIVTAEVLKETSFILNFDVEAKNLPRKKLSLGTDPYVVIMRQVPGGTAVRVWQSTIVKRSRNPKWKLRNLSLQKCCNGDLRRKLIFQIWDYDPFDTDELIGSFVTSLKDLRTNGAMGYDVINANMKDKPGYKNSGRFYLSNWMLIPETTFLDYIVGGCDISLIVAIDFTLSNGNPHNKTRSSLHSYGEEEENEYERCIGSVATILSDYDSDSMFPVYGFGAKLDNGKGKVSHCFPLTGDEENPEVVGVEGIKAVYRKALSEVELFGPTNFAEVIRTAGRYASIKVDQARQKYYVLLIITDGAIDDMEETVDEIIRIGNLPLSIVVVGVGGGRWDAMEMLDADEIPLRASNGAMMPRDCVQFVAFRGLHNHPTALAREVLVEIPGQLTGYMDKRAISPGLPKYSIESRLNTPASSLPGTPRFTPRTPRTARWDPEAHSSIDTDRYHPVDFLAVTPEDVRIANMLWEVRNPRKWYEKLWKRKYRLHQDGTRLIYRPLHDFEIDEVFLSAASSIPSTSRGQLSHRFYSKNSGKQAGLPSPKPLPDDDDPRATLKREAEKRRAQGYV